MDVRHSQFITHIVAIVSWAAFAISVGITALINHEYTLWVALALISAIIGNSWHLEKMAVSQGKITFSSESTSTKGTETATTGEPPRAP